MSSTNKTSLGLNMWEASDKPVRQDFVNDNVIINEKITKLNSDLALTDISSELTIIKTFGNCTITVSRCYKYGKVIQLLITVVTTGTTANGVNLFTGSLNKYRPVVSGGGVSYLAGRSIPGYIDSSGDITVRNTGDVIPTGSSITIHFCYIST